MDMPTIDEMLHREPFEPFRVRMSDGSAYDVRNPGLAVPLKSKLLIAFPDDDRYTVCSLLHITALETLANGSAKRRKN